MREHRLVGAAFTFKSKLVNECSKSLVVKERPPLLVLAEGRTERGISGRRKRGLKGGVPGSVLHIHAITARIAADIYTRVYGRGVKCRRRDRRPNEIARFESRAARRA